jgi:hypothetical protein
MWGSVHQSESLSRACHTCSPRSLRVPGIVLSSSIVRMRDTAAAVSKMEFRMSAVKYAQYKLIQRLCALTGFPVGLRFSWVQSLSSVSHGFKCISCLSVSHASYLTISLRDTGAVGVDSYSVIIPFSCNAPLLPQNAEACFTPGVQDVRHPSHQHKMDVCNKTHTAECIIYSNVPCATSL